MSAMRASGAPNLFGDTDPDRSGAYLHVEGRFHAGRFVNELLTAGNASMLETEIRRVTRSGAPPAYVKGFLKQVAECLIEFRPAFLRKEHLVPFKKHDAECICDRAVREVEECLSRLRPSQATGAGL